jgi:hypothetical protein
MLDLETTTLQRIAALSPEAGCRLRITYADGFTGVVDLAALAESGGVFARLRDAAYFGQVRIGDDRRYIEWPGELDMCADALRMQAEREAGDMGDSSDRPEAGVRE